MTKEEKLRQINPTAYPGLGGKGIKLPLKLVWLEVIDYFEMTSEELRTKTSKREIITPRHVFFYLAKKNTTATLSRIGEFASGENWTLGHSTVWSAIKKVDAVMNYNAEYRHAVKDITLRFENVVKGGKK